MERAAAEHARIHRRASPLVWGMRLLTVVMALVAAVVGLRKFRSTPEQEELTRYAELTVPVYLREWAEVCERLDRLKAPGLGAKEARALLVDEVMPTAIRARKHVAQVRAESLSVLRSNEEYLRAVDGLLEVARTAIAAIDDPKLGPEEGLARVRDRRREADEALRAWMAHLRDRCKAAGLELRARAPGERVK